MKILEKEEVMLRARHELSVLVLYAWSSVRNFYEKGGKEC
jgi:hypothetical protein